MGVLLSLIMKRRPASRSNAECKSGVSSSASPLQPDSLQQEELAPSRLGAPHGAWTSLPCELSGLIFSKVGTASDRCSFRLVCKAWSRDAAQHVDRLVEDITLASLRSLHLPHVLQVFQNTRCLKLRSNRVVHEGEGMEAMLLLSRLQQLELVHVSAFNFRSMTGPLTGLTSLALSCCTEYSRLGVHFASLGLSALSALKNLQAFSFVEQGINLTPACSFAFLSTLSALASLSLSVYNPVRFAFALDLGFWGNHCQMPMLQVVHLKGPAVGDEAVRAVIEACPKLCELLVSSIWFSGSALTALETPVSMTPALGAPPAAAEVVGSPRAATFRKLSLEGCVTLSGSSLRALEGLPLTDFAFSLGDYQEPGGNALQSLLRMPCLTRLVCKCWVGSPDHEPGLFQVVQSLQGLRVLVVHDALFLTDDVVRRKVMPLTRLESLDVWGCHRVTIVGVRALLGLPKLRSLKYSAHIGLPEEIYARGWHRISVACAGHVMLSRRTCCGLNGVDVPHQGTCD